MWHVMDDGADSARLLNTLINTLTQSSLQLVVVKNLGRGEHFECFEESAIYENAIKLGAHIIELPALHARLTQKVDFNNSSFWAAANNINIMTLTERHRVKVWLKTIYQELDSVLSHNTNLASSTLFTTE